MRRAPAPAIVMPAPVPKLWPGETCVVLGGGPSLTREDVDYCGGKAHVIAVKEAYQLAPWAEVLYACEASWWNYVKGAMDFSGLKYGMEPVIWPDVHTLRNTGDEGLELDPSGLRTGGNSGYQAVNLAVHLGADKIVLLGFDMWHGEDGRSNWFNATRPHRNSPYPIFLQRFATLTEPMKQAGVTVINCSRRTMMRAFPQQPLEEALS
jgi:hypothetical protein